MRKIVGSGSTLQTPDVVTQLRIPSWLPFRHPINVLTIR